MNKLNFTKIDIQNPIAALHSGNLEYLENEIEVNSNNINYIEKTTKFNNFLNLKRIVFTNNDSILVLNNEVINEQDDLQ
tara:strand:+ start:70 stop:306 length:237 start_codon:yes stop_codon:yes gene_type:complete